MRVVIDNDMYDESLGVYLDDGTEVGRYTIVDNAEEEREMLERMIKRCIEEAAEAK